MEVFGGEILINLVLEAHGKSLESKDFLHPGIPDRCTHVQQKVKVQERDSGDVEALP